MGKRQIVVSVIGGHSADPETEEKAYGVGKIIAEAGAILVCGGLAGCMEAASKGAKEAGGQTIGLLPGKNKEDANSYIDIPLCTTIGFARNAMVACSADIIIALPGSYGTSSEICYGMVYKKPIIDFGGWNVEGTSKAESLDEVAKKLKDLLDEINE